MIFYHIKHTGKATDMFSMYVDQNFSCNVFIANQAFAAEPQKFPASKVSWHIYMVPAFVVVNPILV